MYQRLIQLHTINNAPTIDIAPYKLGIDQVINITIQQKTNFAV